LTHIAKLAKQAKDSSFLTDGRDIWKMFLQTASALGTTRHEEAVNIINQQLKVVKEEQPAVIFGRDIELKVGTSPF